MSAQSTRAFATRQYPCEECPLRPLKVFREFEKHELAFVSKFKRGELAVEKGATVLVEGNHSAHLYTVLSGWGFRYKLMPDGRRQILNYLLPGDLAEEILGQARTPETVAAMRRDLGLDLP